MSDDRKVPQLPRASGDRALGLLHRVIEIQAELDARKLLYAEYDRLVLELHSLGWFHGFVSGLEIELVDNFASSNTGWTRSAVKRFELKMKKVK